MSYILDALKKAERERNPQQHAPSLQILVTDHHAEQTQFSKFYLSNRLVISLLSGVLLIMLTGLVAQLWHSPTSTDELVVSTTIKQPIVEVSPTMVALPYPTHTAKPSLATVDAMPITIADNTQQSNLQAALAVPVVESKVIPLFSELPMQLRNTLPSLMLNVHVYATEPQQRFVLLNGKRYSESMQVRSDLLLQQIREQDIVLKYRQQRFRLLRPGI